MILDAEDFLAHYGTPRHSGRYPWGSGGEEVPHRNPDFLGHVAALKRQGLSEPDIAKGFGMSTTDLRAAKSIAKNKQKFGQITQAQLLKDTGYSNVAIGHKMGLPESTVRSLLAPGAKEKADALTATANMLKDEVANKKYIDIGAGVENHINVSKDRLNTAVTILRDQGYEVHAIKVRQIGTGLETRMKVLAAPKTPWAEVNQNRDKVQQITSLTENNGGSYGPKMKHDPVSIHPDRVAVRYAEQGGTKADGVIYVRPGKEDLSLGTARYAQVRIKVGDGHYLKGMAMYKDDLPNGVDLLFNTNKSNTGNKLDAMKQLEKDPDFPFGSVVRQHIVNPGGKDEHVKSAMNIVNEEGNWGKWSKSLSSQMLSKQNPILAKTQLEMVLDQQKREYNQILGLTNPTVRKKLLDTFADSTDAASVNLKAHALPKQGTHVILPIESMPPHQIYAPKYNDGEKVVLIRHPHGGTFEIPELTVNNKQPEAKRLLKNARDAIGIHHSVAERLSGADFDGDTVLVIPNNRGRVKHSPALEDLKSFNPMMYKLPENSPIPRMTKRQKGLEMGNVSNLITDMTIKLASHAEIARAVKHSMVVIDAEKHGLDFRQSAKDNNISELKAKYQIKPGSSGKGASTLISLARSEVRLPERKPRPMAEGGPVDRATGKKVFVETGRTRVDKKGKDVPVLTRFDRLAVTDNAHDLSSGTPMEKIYADHSNKLKDLANQARLSSINTPTLNYSPSAKRVYSAEVAQLNAALTLAKRNAPLERQAQVIANTVVKAKRDANPNLDDDSLKKIKFSALTEARNRMGAGKQKIELEQRHWDAIQAGAVSNHKLTEILKHADLDRVRELATPSRRQTMSASMLSRARQMLESGYSTAEIASHLGVSTSTLDASLYPSENQQ